MCLQAKRHRTRIFTRKINSVADREGGGTHGRARTGTDGHDRHEHHTPSTNKTKYDAAFRHTRHKPQAAASRQARDGRVNQHRAQATSRNATQPTRWDRAQPTTQLFSNPFQ